MKTFPMRTALAEIFQAGLSNARFEVAYNNETIFTSDSVFYELCKYTDYLIGVSEIFTPSTAHFITLYSDYRANVKAQLYREWQALNANYDPVSNYDMTESSHDGRKLSKETVTATPTGGTQTEINRFGIDSGADGAPYDKTTVTPLEGTKTETEKEYTSDKTITDNDGNTLSGYHEANDHYLKRKGNIGTTLASDMVSAEAELREKYNDLLLRYVKGFIDRYCFYVGGC